MRKSEEKMIERKKEGGEREREKKKNDRKREKVILPDERRCEMYEVNLTLAMRGTSSVPVG